MTDSLWCHTQAWGLAAVLSQQDSQATKAYIGQAGQYSEPPMSTDAIPWAMKGAKGTAGEAWEEQMKAGKHIIFSRSGGQGRETAAC